MSYLEWREENSELHWWTHLIQVETGLPVIIWVDDIGNYTTKKHRKCIKIQLNTKNELQSKNVGTITIEDNPQFINHHKLKYDLSQSDINIVIEFVKQYKDELSDMADQRISTTEFLENICFNTDILRKSNVAHEQWMDEHINRYEMISFMKVDSGLPVNLWLDIANNYYRNRHIARIKFQLNTLDDFQIENLGVITIDDEPEVIILPEQKCDLSQSDIDTLIEFVKIYKNDLFHLANQKTNYLDLLKNVILKNKLMATYLFTERQLKLYHKILLSESSSPQPVEGELAEYYVLKASLVKTKYSLFVDESESYKRYKHPLWIYVETHIEPTYKQYYGRLYIPITVEKNPRIIGDVTNLDIDMNELQKIQQFISHNVSILKKIANMKIRWYDAAIYFKAWFPYMNESKDILLEMGNYFKRDTGLPVNVWLDQGWDKPHAERIKVQNNTGNKITHNDFITIPIFANTGIIGDVRLNSHQVFLVTKFIEYNRQNLLLLQRKQITKEEFGKYIIKIDDKGNPIYPDNENETSWKPINGHTSYGLTRVVSNTGRYNFINNNKELISDTWFDEASMFQRENDRYVSYVSIGNDYYKLYSDGDLFKL